MRKGTGRPPVLASALLGIVALLLVVLLFQGVGMSIEALCCVASVVLTTIPIVLLRNRSASNPDSARVPRSSAGPQPRPHEKDAGAVRRVLFEYGLLAVGVALFSLAALSILGPEVEDLTAATASVLPGAHDSDMDPIVSGQLIETTDGGAELRIELGPADLGDLVIEPR